jgi:hypothetical protein
MSTENTLGLDTSDVCERLVGITPLYLNNFLQRGLFGLQPSVQSGKVRAKRRLFSQDDVFGIALVWLLFESGLRTDPIIRVLKDVAGTKEASANLAGRKLLKTEADYLLIVRQPRTPTKSPEDKPGQIVRLLTRAELPDAVQQHANSELLVIPVSAKFADVRKRLELLFPESK